MDTFERLESIKRYITQQQYKTILGQIKAGDLDGANRGIDKVMRRLSWS